MALMAAKPVPNKTMWTSPDFIPTKKVNSVGVGHNLRQSKTPPTKQNAKGGATAINSVLRIQLSRPNPLLADLKPVMLPTKDPKAIIGRQNQSTSKMPVSRIKTYSDEDIGVEYLPVATLPGVV